MNILMLTSSYPKYDGETTAPFIEEIAAGLVRRGHGVTVVAPFHPQLRRAPVERGVRLHFYRYAPHPALNIYGYAESLRGDVGLRGAAIVAAPLAVGASLSALLGLAQGGRGRRPSEQQPVDCIHAHWVLPNGLPALVAARARELPLAVSLHGSDVYLAGKAWPLAVTAAAIFRSAGAITACSSELRERALRLGARPTDVEVIPYGVDAGAFRPDPFAAAAARRELGIAPDTPLVLAIGRMVHKKGFAHLIDAFPQVLAAHPDARLVLAGYGDLREELERRAATLGLAGRIVFPGQLERDVAARAIGAADVYVVPSVRDQAGNVDGLPNTLLEGMSAARPLVATRIAGIPDVVADGVHGLLVPEADPAALAGAITQLLGDGELARRLGEAARRRVVEELTWDAAASRYEAALRRATGRG
jgi:glycosyltransferase involved in cell wall biosynthesis